MGQCGRGTDSCACRRESGDRHGLHPPPLGFTRRTGVAQGLFVAGIGAGNWKVRTGIGCTVLHDSCVRIARF
jgi:hypothetical protein